MNLAEAPLGKKTAYVSHYQRDLLFPIARKTNRAKLGLSDSLPFKGVDIWNAYEISWLNSKGKPVVALGEFIFPCESPNLVEAKSFKLYLNSFNNTPFANVEEVIATLQRDLSDILEAPIQVRVNLVDQFIPRTTSAFSGINLDQLDISCDTYLINPDFLQTENEIVSEVLFSDLLKSNCLITGQPDWGSVQIHYTGKKIQHVGLLQYIVSFRDHNEFGEQCVERMFMDILQRCAPQKLSIYARYTRRGGKDINPYRSTEEGIPDNFQLCRQ
jgi:7-cyano-7-deazaguanine reductase